VLSCEVNIFLTIFGLHSERLGLVRAILSARGLDPQRNDSVNPASWTGTVTSGDQAALVNALIKLKNLSFEMETWIEGSGERIVYTPALGLASAAIDEFGSVNLTEHRIRELMAQANQNMITFGRLMDQALLVGWDAEFEAIREDALQNGEARLRTSVA
jgi:hypothetical protein